MNIRYPIYEGVYRILTVEVPVVNSGIFKWDIGRNHIEVTVIIGLYGLETVYGHSAFRIEG